MNEYKKIILAIPNSGSQSLKKVINIYTDYKCNKVRINIINLSAFINIFRLILIKLFIGIFKIFQKIYFSSRLMEKVINFLSSSEYTYLGIFHSDAYIKDVKFYKKILLTKKNNIILKQHFSPSKQNKEFLKNYKKVLLFRETNAVLNKYNSRLKKTNSLVNIFLLNKIKEDVKKWKENWSNEPNTLILKFEDLIDDPVKNLLKVQNFFDMKFNLPDDFKYPNINKTKPPTV
jgi:hypothetical protein